MQDLRKQEFPHRRQGWGKNLKIMVKGKVPVTDTSQAQRTSNLEQKKGAEDSDEVLQGKHKTEHMFRGNFYLYQKIWYIKYIIKAQKPSKQQQNAVVNFGENTELQKSRNIIMVYSMTQL